MLRVLALGCAGLGVSLLSIVVVHRALSDLQRLLVMLRRDTDAALQAIYLFIPLTQWVRMLMLPWLCAVALLGYLLPLKLWLVVVPVSCIAPLWILQRVRKRRAQRFRQQLPDMLALLSAGLKSGVPLLANFNMLANEVATPMRDELKVMLRQLRLGQTLPEILDDWLVRLPSRDLEQVVLAIKLGQHSGGQQAQILARLAETMRRKQQLQLKVMALTAQGRMQGKVMVALPVLIIGALYLIERPTILALSRHLLGWVTAGVLLMLLGIGYYLVRKQVNVEVPV